jgi:predicted nucleotidyltransferase
MASNQIPLPPHYQAVLDRFVTVCREDQRVVAALLGGSYATGTADLYSDLDLGLITTDGAYEDFLKDYVSFISLVGEPELLEDFDLPHNVFFIFSDGTEGELAIGCESRFKHIQLGPYQTLLDKKGVLTGVVFSGEEVDPAEQTETLRRLIYWFWHDLSHFIAAIGRGQLWWAYGQLEILRSHCLNLVRKQNNFTGATEGYEKIEKAVPLEQLAPLQTTFCPLERDPMLQAVTNIVRFYQQIAPPLARAHQLAYPERLSHLMSDRLAKLSGTL